MLTETETLALSRWYRRDEVISTAKRLLAAEEWDDLEEHLQMRCLFPLSRHSELPDYLRTESGSPLFPTNLNPRQDLEKWQDAIGVGWQVLEEETGVSQAEIALKRDSEQERDWQEFLRRYEERKARETGA